jgi:hypothetical protein
MAAASAFHPLMGRKQPDRPAQNPILGLAPTIRHLFTAKVRLLFIGTRLQPDREAARASLPVHG